MPLGTNQHRMLASRVHELIAENHHITARSSQNNRIFLKLQKSTTIALVASNVH
jgi:hypothetical protein